MIAEVLSPSTRHHDRGVKMQRYAAFGIPYYWTVDPEGKWIECYRLEGGVYRHALTAEGDTQFACPEWPDLIISLADLWR